MLLEAHELSANGNPLLEWIWFISKGFNVGHFLNIEAPGVINNRVCTKNGIGKWKRKEARKQSMKDQGLTKGWMLCIEGFHTLFHLSCHVFLIHSGHHCIVDDLSTLQKPGN